MQRSLPVLAMLALLGASAAVAQTTPPASRGTGGPTGSSNPAVNTTGNAPSTVNPSGTANIVAASALEKGANSFTEGQAKSRLEGAGLMNVTDLKKDDDGVWRGKACATARASPSGSTTRATSRRNSFSKINSATLTPHRRNDHEANHHSYVRYLSRCCGGGAQARERGHSACRYQHRLQ